MKIINISLPINKEQLLSLNAGDKVTITGTVFTARDAAHKRLIDLIKDGRPLPVDLSNSAIYYTGPVPAKYNEIIGACGPTSSTRMDEYTPLMIDNGVSVMIGKGARADYVIRAMHNRAVYLLAVGGAAVYYRQFVTGCEIAAYEDLGTEAVRRLTVKDMPLIVGIDSKGKSILK